MSFINRNLICFLNILIGLLEKDEVVCEDEPKVVSYHISDNVEPKLLYTFSRNGSDIITEVLCDELEFPIKIETDGKIYFKINRIWMLQIDLIMVSVERYVE